MGSRDTRPPVSVRSSRPIMTTAATRTFIFGAGNPDPGVFPSVDIGEAARRVLARRGQELAHYPEPHGLPELRAIAQERFERNHHVRPPLDDIVITSGANQGLHLSAQGLAKPGDAVIVEEFEYVGTLRIFRQLGRTTQPLERRLRLIELARKHRIPIVEDDTYADISFEPLLERAIYTLAEPGEVMYIGSFSKILGPGLRLGFFIAPEPLRSTLMAWKLDGGTSMLSQLVAAEYLTDHLWEHIGEAAGAVKEKRNILLDALEGEFGAVPGMHWTHPDGGLFLWIKLPEQLDRARLQELATARGITYATGQAFHALDKDIPYLRLSFGWIEKEDIAEGVRILAECVREALPATVS